MSLNGEGNDPSGDDANNSFMNSEISITPSDDQPSDLGNPSSVDMPFPVDNSFMITNNTPNNPPLVTNPEVQSYAGREQEQLEQSVPKEPSQSSEVAEERVVGNLLHPCGIDSIPDDMLKEIFEQAFDPQLELPHEESRAVFKVPGELGTTLSLVNKRFRHIAMSTPRLWSHFSADHHKLYKRDLKRCGTVNLHVNLFDQIVIEEENEEFLSALIDNIGRWETFRYYHQTAKGDDKISKIFEKKLGNKKELPNLRSFLVQSDVHKPKEFYKDWNMPNLENLTIQFFIPQSCYSAKSLVFLDYLHGIEGVDMHCLLSFLKELPSLEKLVLNFIRCDTVAREEAAPIAKLPKLRDLNVTFDVFANPTSFASSLFEKLDIPSLAHLSVELRASHGHFCDDGPKFLREVRILQKVSKHLEDLTLSLKNVTNPKFVTEALYELLLAEPSERRVKNFTVKSEVLGEFKEENLSKKLASSAIDIMNFPSIGLGNLLSLFDQVLGSTLFVETISVKGSVRPMREYEQIAYMLNDITDEDKDTWASIPLSGDEEDEWEDVLEDGTEDESEIAIRWT